MSPTSISNGPLHFDEQKAAANLKIGLYEFGQTQGELMHVFGRASSLDIPSASIANLLALNTNDHPPSRPEEKTECAHSNIFRINGPPIRFQ